MEPLLSVVTITYNHAPYIRKCIEGVLMQQVNFPMEFIIADDCSTDGTRLVCEAYAAKYPNLIRLAFTERNVGAVENEQRAFISAKGKYIATCEGDDYWTDPLKLQKQVDFLESHPDFSVCFHRFKKIHVASGKEEGDGCDNLFHDSVADGLEISMHQFMHQWVTQYLTMVFRKDCYDFDAPEKYKYYRDTHQIYHLMLHGRCWLSAFEGGVYQMTGDGIYSTRSAFMRDQMTLKVDEELWKVNGDKRWKEMCVIVMQHMIDVFHGADALGSRLVMYTFYVLFMTGNLKQFCKNTCKVLGILK